MKDLVSTFAAIAALAPAVLAATSTSAALDLQGFNSAAFVVHTGAIVSAGDFTVSIQESDTTTSGDFADVDTADLSGTLPATLEENSVYRVGYTGAKRYLRVVVTKNGGTSIATSILLVKGHPEDAPVA